MKNKYYLRQALFSALISTSMLFCGCNNSSSTPAAVAQCINTAVAQPSIVSATPTAAPSSVTTFYATIYQKATSIGNNTLINPNTASNAYKAAVTAYFWGFPLEQFWEKEGIFNTAGTPINTLKLANTIDTSTTIVSPNTSVLYANGFLDLSTNPYKISYPQSSTYNVLQIMDAYTNVQASVGTRSNTCDDVVIYWANASYASQVAKAYPNAIAVYSPQVWLIGRVAVDTYAVQTENGIAQTIYQTLQGYATSLLALWQSQNVLSKYSVQPLTSYVNTNTSSTAQSQVTSAASTYTAFYTNLANAVKQNGLIVNYSGVSNGLLNTTTTLYDQSAMFNNFAAIGLTSNGFNTSSLSASDITDITNGYAAAQSALNAIGNSGTALSANNYWTISTSLGQYAPSYSGWIAGAAVGAVGLGANLGADGTYPRATQDANGNTLNGANNYKIDFSRSGIPPITSGFWSVTVYDSQNNIYASTANSYYYTSQIGGVYALGSIQLGNTSTPPVLYLQNSAPSAEKLQYWIPTPTANFSVLLRVYNPLAANNNYQATILNPPATPPSITSPTWTPPAVTAY